MNAQTAPKLTAAAFAPGGITSEKYGTAYHETADPRQLKQHPRNPPQRTNPKSAKYKELRDAVMHDGGVLAELHVSSDGYVQDGNTRRAVAVELGLDTVPILRYEKTHRELEALGLYDELNSTCKGFKPKDQFAYALAGGKVDNKAITAKVAFVRSTLNAAELEVFLRSKPSPSLVDNAKAVTSYCLERGDVLTEAKTIAFFRKTVMWLIRHKAQRPVIVYMTLKKSHDKLRKAVENNRPVPAIV